MVEAIQILTQTVHTIIAVVHAIWVEHGNDHEVEVFSQQNSLGMLADQKFYKSFEGIAGSDLSRVHSRCDEDQRLVDFSEVMLVSIGEKVLYVFFRRVFESIAAGDGQ